MTYNDLGCWANMRLAFIKQHRLQLYQSLLKENRLHSYLVEFDSQVRDTLILTEEEMRQTESITEEPVSYTHLQCCYCVVHPRSRKILHFAITQVVGKKLIETIVINRSNAINLSLIHI